MFLGVYTCLLHAFITLADGCWHNYFWIIKLDDVKKQKVIIADNNRYFREGLKQILLNIGNVKIVAEVNNGFSLLNALENLPADIVFTDVEMPIVDCAEVVKFGRFKYPKSKFYAFSSKENNRYVEKLREAGASGYLFKSNNNYDLLAEIIQNHKEESFLSPKVPRGKYHKSEIEAFKYHKN